MNDRAPLMLLDSASLYFRAYFGVPETVTAPDGMPVNAVRGFCDMISTLVRRYRPGSLVACLDLDWRPAFRVELIPSYKAHRVETPGHDAEPDVEQVPDTLSPQVPVILAVLKAAGLCALGCEGFEADDVIATLADRADRDGRRVDVVSGDRDLIGVVTDNVRLVYTGRGMAKLEELDPPAVAEKYSITAGHYADFAALRGDPSDGLPGVPGVGEKTAASLVSRFGPIEDIVAAAQDSGSGMTAPERRKILAALDYLAVAPAVVRGRTDLPVADPACVIPAQPADPDMLAALGEEFGIASALQRLTSAMAEVGS